MLVEIEQVGLEKAMNLSLVGRVSDKILQDWHQLVRRAIKEDDDSGLPASETPNGTRHHNDWRPWADEIEKQLVNRQIEYVPLTW